MVSILIIDDSFSKEEKISEILKDIDIKVDLDHVTNIVHARQQIRNKQYDIVIVDLKIKSTTGSIATIEDGLDFIPLILNDKKCILPKEFFFLTELEEQDQADYKIRVASSSSKLWYFQSDYAEWMNYLKSRIGFYNEYNSRKYFDILLITALEEEFKAISNSTGVIKWSKSTRMNQVSSCVGKYYNNHKEISCLLISPFKKGMSSISALSSLAFQNHKPRVAFLLGLCAGTNKKQQEFGDTIISSFIWDYHSGKIIDGGIFQNAPYQTKATEDLFDILTNNFHDDHNKYSQYVSTNYTSLQLKKNWTIHFGPTVSGGTVIADEHTVSTIHQQHKDILAIDMEGYGFYEALQYHPNVSGCMIKSISDFGDKDKNEGCRPLALDMTNKILEEVLKSEELYDLLNEN